MRLHDVFAILGVAAATMAAALVSLAPRGVGAVDAAPPITPLIAQPQFTSHDCTFTLETEKPLYATGENPMLLLTAVNPTDAPRTATVWIEVTSTAPVSPVSRMMPLPRSLWSHECQVSLLPGETKTLKVAIDAALPVSQQIAIALSDTRSVMRMPAVQVQAPADLIRQAASLRQTQGGQP